MSYAKMFTPISLGGLVLKNRIVFAPTSLGMRQEEEIKKLSAIAQGGCAMVIVGDVPVGKHEYLSLFSHSGFQHYQQICQAVHRHECLACAQLHQSDSNLSGMLKHIPDMIFKKLTQDDLRRLMNEEIAPGITAMPAKKIREITASFGPAARQAQEAGFDMIQVHGDRMCGSFSSEVFNHRTDEYGGSPKKRAEFAVEAVMAVRRELPHMPIDYKLAVRQENPHYGNAGVLLEELSVFVPMLEKAGVTSFHVTLADHSSLSDPIPPKNHPYFPMEGCFLPYCDEVRRYTKLPVCGVGGLTDPEFIENQIESGRIDFAAMSRQLIADAEWPNKARQGQCQTIHRCIRCNQLCLNGMLDHKGVHCIFDRTDSN